MSVTRMWAYFSKKDFVIALIVACFFTISLPGQVAFDGLLYQMSARSIFTSQFEDYYNFQREPGYPIFLKLTLKIGFETDLIYVFAQSFLLFLGIILLSKLNWEILTFGTKKFPEKLNLVMFVLILLNPQATIWLNFLTKQALISIFLVFCQIHISGIFLQLRLGQVAPKGALSLLKVFITSIAIGVIGYSISLAPALGYIFSLGLAFFLGFFVLCWHRLGDRPNALRFRPILLRMFLRMLGGSLGVTGSRHLWESYANSRGPGWSLFQHIEGRVGSTIFNFKSSPKAYIYSAVDSFRSLIGFGDRANGDGAYGQEARRFANHAFFHGRECGSIVEYENSWFEGLLDPDYAYWIRPVCKPELFVSIHRYFLPLSEITHSGTILAGVIGALVVIAVRRQMLEASMMVVSYGFIGVYAISQVLSLDRYGVPLFFLSVAFVVPYVTHVAKNYLGKPKRLFA